jgi:transketolase
MRKEFAVHMERLAVGNDKIIFLAGDVGFMALESLRAAIGDRFINAGVSEQNMISMAASLAFENLLPVVYSIAPFVTLRPAEQIKLDVCLHDLNVKIIGNGGGYGYGIMGATHHALEDLSVLSSFQNMRCFIPFCNEDVKGVMDEMFACKGPSYLRLGLGLKPPATHIPELEPVRWLNQGESLTIVCLGPIVLNVINAIAGHFNPGPADVFVVTEMPLKALPSGLIRSIQKTGKLLIIEEQVSRGGLGENLALLLIKAQITCRVIHRYALGYPEGLYGDQGYHQAQCGMDPQSIARDIQSLLQ